MAFINEVGNVYGSWIVIERAEPSATATSAQWWCECECGGLHVIAGGHLRNGASTRCRSCIGREQHPKGKKVGEPAILTLEERFRDKYEVDPVTGCWNWTGALSSQNKYGSIGESSHMPEYAHRVSWEAVHGPIPKTPAPDGSRWEIHHTCHNFQCCFIEHLRLLSHKEHCKLHRLTAPLRPWRNVPSTQVLDWNGFAWHRRSNGGWFWSAKL